jgi:hypothetical protein
MSHFRRSAPLLLAVVAALAIPATASATHFFSFAPQANYDLPPGPPSAINIGDADADGDGTEDIIVTSPTTNTITIDHLNGTTMEQEKVTALFFQSQVTGPTSVVTLQEDGKSSYAIGMTNPSALLGDIDDGHGHRRAGQRQGRPEGDAAVEVEVAVAVDVAHRDARRVGRGDPVTGSRDREL